MQSKTHKTKLSISSIVNISPLNQKRYLFQITENKENKEKQIMLLAMTEIHAIQKWYKTICPKTSNRYKNLIVFVSI